MEGGRRAQALLLRASDRAGGPIAFAGLWETWTGPNGEEMETAAIVTAEAGPTLATVHHRAPVVVPPDQFDFWLDSERVDETMAAELIAPAPEGSMAVYEVSPAVNRVANDSPSCSSRTRRRAAEPPAADRNPSRKARAGPPTRGQGSLF